MPANSDKHFRRKQLCERGRDRDGGGEVGIAKFCIFIIIKQGVVRRRQGRGCFFRCWQKKVCLQFYIYC